MEGFIDAMDPHGLFLWVATVSEDQEIDIVKRLNHWS
jgi:hypothetical protein